MSQSEPLSPRTLAAQALGLIDERTRAIVPPIHLATTFERDPDNLYRSGNSYGRPDNDTVREAEALIGALEGAATTLVFGSGMSAAIAVFLSLGPGAHVIAPNEMYWALRALARQRGAGARTERRFRRRRGFAGGCRGAEARGDEARLARDAEQSAMGRERHRRRGPRRSCGGRGACGRLRLARRPFSPGRSLSAPTW